MKTVSRLLIFSFAIGVYILTLGFWGTVNNGGLNNLMVDKVSADAVSEGVGTYIPEGCGCECGADCGY